MIVKTAVENFYRDTDNNALINTNKEAYKLYKQQRNTNITIDQLQDEVQGLRDDMNDIKDMLRQLVNRDKE